MLFLVSDSHQALKEQWQITNTGEYRDDLIIQYFQHRPLTFNAELMFISNWAVLSRTETTEIEKIGEILDSGIMYQKVLVKVLEKTIPDGSESIGKTIEILAGHNQLVQNELIISSPLKVRAFSPPITVMGRVWKNQPGQVLYTILFSYKDSQKQKKTVSINGFWEALPALEMINDSVSTDSWDIYRISMQMTHQDNRLAYRYRLEELREEFGTIGEMRGFFKVQEDISR